MVTKSELLARPIEHLSLETFNPVPLIDAMDAMAFQARNLSRACAIYERNLRETDCGVILCLAGSLVSAGLRTIVVELIERNMVDCIVSTGANIVDQDFLEALGFRHYVGTPYIDDKALQELHIDRIYDTFIDEDELRICDDTCAEIADGLEPRPYSSREFIAAMGAYLRDRAKGERSIVRTCYEKGVPIFCPAFSDCSAGFGLVSHQHRRGNEGAEMVSIDSAKDFRELTQLKIELRETGLLMLGGGVPKNFAQDVVVAADVLGIDVPMHKYAVQITVADERDGGLSGSTLREANSWGKVDSSYEQMVYGEATLLFPLLAGYAYHKQAYEARPERRLNEMLDDVSTTTA